MEKSYVPKGGEANFCEGLNLCSVRKDTAWKTKVGVKYMSKEMTEIYLEDVAYMERFEDKDIVRIYSSGFIFMTEDKEKVFLVTTEKNWKRQVQFCWGAPIEDENKDAIIKKDWKYSFDITKIRENARIRAINRVSVNVTQFYNDEPLVDWALVETLDPETNETYFKLVCLMHFVASDYEGELKTTWNENVVDGKRYEIDSLNEVEWIAPNAYIVSKEARLEF